MLLISGLFIECETFFLFIFSFMLSVCLLLDIHRFTLESVNLV